MCNTDFLKPLGEIKNLTQKDIGDYWAVRGYCSCKASVIESFKTDFWFYYRASYSEHGLFFFQVNVPKITAQPAQVAQPETTTKIN
jgi:hypothetical protein